jgi:hypothetical protein
MARQPDWSAVAAAQCEVQGLSLAITEDWLLSELRAHLNGAAKRAADQS